MKRYTGILALIAVPLLLAACGEVEIEVKNDYGEPLRVGGIAATQVTDWDRIARWRSWFEENHQSGFRMDSDDYRCGSAGRWDRDGQFATITEIRELGVTLRNSMDTTTCFVPYLSITGVGEANEKEGQRRTRWVLFRHPIGLPER